MMKRRKVGVTWAHRLIYRLLRICHVECSIREVVRRTYPRSSRTLLPTLDGATTSGLKFGCELAVRLEQAETARRGAIDDKAKWLFAVTSLLLTVLIGVLTKLPTYRVFIGVLAVVPLFLTGVLLIWYFGVGTGSSVIVSKSLVEAPDEDTARRVLLRATASSVAWNAARTDFQVDVFRAAARLVAVAIALVAATATLALARSQPSSEEFVTRLLVDPKLGALLRGPPCPVGPSGYAGPPGEPGAAGPLGACRCDLVPGNGSGSERPKTQ